LIWKASWIWATGDPDASAQFLLFRRSVTLRQRPRLASAFCTASRKYQLFVNGRLVGRGPSPGGPRWQPYDAHDLSPYLERGANVIAALCFHEAGEPRFGRAADSGGGRSPGSDAAPGGFLFQVAIDDGGDGARELVSDERWRCWRAAPWRAPFGESAASRTSRRELGEICDSRREPVGWLLPGFNDAGWVTPDLLGPALTPPWERLVPRQIPFLREEAVSPLRSESKDPQPASPGGNRTLHLDFGRLMVGYPCLRVPASAQGTLELTYGDWVDADGRLVARPGEPRQVDRLLLPARAQKRAGSERLTWQPFGRRAFRYLEATLQSGDAAAPPSFWPLTAEGLSVAAVGYPVEEGGEFRCSDPLLDEIWALGRETLRCAMQEQYESCPIRAPVQRVSDTRIDALMNYYAFGDYRLVGQALWQLAQRQRSALGARRSAEEGPVLPSAERRAPSAEERSDELLWVLMLADYLRYSGDERLARQLLPELRARLTALHAATNEHGLIGADGREETAPNALYAAALREAAALARRLEDSGGEYEHRERSVRQAFNWSLWSESEHAFATERTRDGLSHGVGSHANWLVLYLEAAEPARRRLVLRRLLADRPAILRLSPAFQFYVLETLFREGYVEDALDLIRSVWGEMLRRGATACWERLEWPEATGVPAGSLCHAASGAPTYLLPARVLGVTPRQPAGLVVRPCPTGLEWAEGTVPTLRGPARFGWRKHAEGFELTADLPPALQADLILPLGAGESGPRTSDSLRPVATWEGRVFWPVEHAERGVELEHPAELTPQGLRVRITGPKRVVLTSRY
jgi:alpha-L-rhamnosidase